MSKKLTSAEVKNQATAEVVAIDVTPTFDKGQIAPELLNSRDLRVELESIAKELSGYVSSRRKAQLLRRRYTCAFELRRLEGGV